MMEDCLRIAEVVVSTKSPRSFHLTKAAFSILLCNGLDFLASVLTKISGDLAMPNFW